VEDNISLSSRSLHTKIFLKIVKVKKGERHHREKKVVDMKAIVNICASKEVTHKDHARGA
jgi:hypothetical protein